MYEIQNITNNYETYELAGYSYVPHLHNSIEILYVEEGTVKLNIEQRSYQVDEGCLAVVFPFQIHFYNNDFEKIKGKMVCFRLDEVNLNCIPTTPIIPKTETVVLDLFSKPEILFNKIFPKLNCQDIEETNLSATQILLNYCYNNFLEPLTLNGVAKQLSINKFYISHIFNSKLGIGFTDYLARLRVCEAMRLLRCTNISITNIAYDSGFSTIRSFNRRFREFTGISPKIYRTKTQQKTEP